MSGLDAAKLVKDAFRELKKAIPQSVRTISYSRYPEDITNTVYNPITGETTVSVQTKTVEAIFTNFTRKEKQISFEDNSRVNIETGDMKVLIPYVNLGGNPTNKDTLTEVTNEVWQVVDWSVDPTMSALITLQVRKV